MYVCYFVYFFTCTGLISTPNEAQQQACLKDVQISCLWEVWDCNFFFLSAVHVCLLIVIQHLGQFRLIFEWAAWVVKQKHYTHRVVSIIMQRINAIRGQAKIMPSQDKMLSAINELRTFSVSTNEIIIH